MLKLKSNLDFYLYSTATLFNHFAIKHYYTVQSRSDIVRGYADSIT
ncbi:MAG: hypothetical protein WCR42_11920 [bacterium]